MKIKKGFYKHYKGGLYEVISFAKHTETEEPLVIYRDTKGHMWARPGKMWIEFIGNVRRFERFEDQKEGRIAFYLLRHQHMKIKTE